MKGHPREFEKAHELRVVRHIERLQMLTAILQTHESFDYNDQDRDYVKDLKYRISKTKSQLRNMGEDYLFTV
jgi:hypothetical protein